MHGYETLQDIQLWQETLRGVLQWQQTLQSKQHSETDGCCLGTRHYETYSYGRRHCICTYSAVKRAADAMAGDTAGTATATVCVLGLAAAAAAAAGMGGVGEAAGAVVREVAGARAAVARWYTAAVTCLCVCVCVRARESVCVCELGGHA
eukprot:1160775-Pelagomonas_calceolata.AAC.4